MSTIVKIKRSAVQGKVPLDTDLELGELAINTYDGKLFLKKSVGGANTIVDVTATAAGGTNISTSANTSAVIVISNTGDDGVILAANSTSAGILTAEAQTISGIKTFTSNVLIGTTTDNTVDRLQVNGSILATSFNGALSGNATTATTLQTTRTINGVSFNGSADITVTANTSNSLTFNNGGTGAASGSSFNGGSSVTISHNTIGASPLAGSSSLTTTGTVTSGTWSASFGAVSGANLTNLTAGNLSGTIPSAVLGNSTVYVGTTAIALNRASAAQTLTGVSIDGNAATATKTSATVTGTNSADLVTGFMAGNDSFRIRIGGTASDVGFVEIATGDNGNEPIYVRQYSGAGFTTITRTATLLDESGNTSFPGNVTSSSDARLKTNIHTIDCALDKVNQLRGVYFDKDGRTNVGVIAQEIEEVLPEVVINGDDGYKSVAYGNITGLLIEAVKEMKKEIEELTAVINKMKEGDRI